MYQYLHKLNITFLQIEFNIFQIYPCCKTQSSSLLFTHWKSFIFINLSNKIWKMQFWKLFSRFVKWIDSSLTTKLFSLPVHVNVKTAGTTFSYILTGKITIAIRKFITLNAHVIIINRTTFSHLFFTVVNLYDYSWRRVVNIRRFDQVRHREAVLPLSRTDNSHFQNNSLFASLFFWGEISPKRCTALFLKVISQSFNASFVGINFKFSFTFPAPQNISTW